MSTTVAFGEANATFGNGVWSIALDAAAMTETEGVAAVRGILAACQADTPGRVEWWVEDAGDGSDRIAETLGLTCDRELHQLRRPLPLPDTTDLVTRPFRPGSDDEAWLDVNNRAFDWHEEQGRWTADRLAARMAESWFDPKGFLLHEEDGQLAGFCWTKVHDDTRPRLGEIFVIAVDPDFHGRGLGRALTLAGLQHLAGLDITTGMLYVESDNDAAVALYGHLGFEIHQRNRRYVGTTSGTAVPPSEVETFTE